MFAVNTQGLVELHTYKCSPTMVVISLHAFIQVPVVPVMNECSQER